MIHDAIEFYHELLTPSVADATWAELDAALRARRLVFGDRIVCSVMRPYFINPDEEAMIRTAAAGVRSALHRVLATVAPDRYEETLGLSPGEAALARIPGRFEPVESIARLDGFLDRGAGYRFVEYNAESPGGVAFGNTLANVFLDLPVMQLFRERYEVRSEPVLDHSLDALLGAWRAWGGTGTPNVAIVDWATSPTYVEFEICRDRLGERDVPVRIVDPAELSYTDGRLRAGDFTIDLVYRRLVASEIPDRLGLDHPLVAAARDGVACIASGFGAFALTSKALFALLSDPATRPDLTGAESRAVFKHIPWTRILRDGRTTDWEGRGVGLYELAQREQQQMVVKPATEYGGVGVVLGWTVDATTWERALREAGERCCVLQRRVALPIEQFPIVVDGRLELAEFLADLDPYCFGGRTDLGAGTRLSRSQLLNVTAGGGSAAPVFTIEAK